MSDGKTHAVGTKRMLVVGWAATASYCAYSGTLEPLAVGSAVGFLLGHLVTPDIDHHKITYEESRMFRVNRLWGWVWVLYWWPYEKLFVHRGLSHAFLLGTATRFAYLLWPIFLFEYSPYLLLGIYLSWCVQDAVHILLDRFGV